jgi:hypothetical protein
VIDPDVPLVLVVMVVIETYKLRMILDTIILVAAASVPVQKTA